MIKRMNKSNLKVLENSYKSFVKKRADILEDVDEITPEEYRKYNVKRGLRNANGTGVVVGLTNIGEVNGYTVNENREKVPAEGTLYYRGYDIYDLVRNIANENRFGFEEVTYLLLFGELPDKDELELFKKMIGEKRELPKMFATDIILSHPSRSIMNKIQRSILSLYSYDEQADNTSVENVIRQSIDLI